MDDYERSERRTKLLYDALVSPDRIRNPRALQHLKEGFNRRVLMIDASLRFIEDTVQKAGGRRISPYTATDLAIHINALYLNLCGALDNLAWALQYQKQLFVGVTETGKGRRKVDLFNELFLLALQHMSPSLVATIREHAKWHAGLRSLRDPAAHRIPIYAVPGIMNEHQAERSRLLEAQGNDLIAAGKRHEGMDLLFQAGNLGAYQPIMSLSHQDRFDFRNVLAQTAEDDQHFIQVAESVLRYLFDTRADVGEQPGTSVTK